MGKLIIGDDGLVAEEVGEWVTEKHNYLCRYLDISRATRAKWLGEGKAGATYIDLFCGTGRCQIRNTNKWVDGGVVAAWKKSLEKGTPFTRMYINDLDEERLDACKQRLYKLNAPVVTVNKSAEEAVGDIILELNPYALHFAFLDPFNLQALNFSIIRKLSALRRIDMLVHISQMDLQRNLLKNVTLEMSAFDDFAPGWRNAISIKQSTQEIRRQLFEYWKQSVSNLGVWPSTDMRLIRAEKNQPLYWLLLAAKHELAHDFWHSTVQGPQIGFDF